MIENMRRAFVLSAFLVTLVFLLPLSVGYLSTVQAGGDASPPLLANSTIAPNAQINAPAANPVPELTWTTGEPYPVVNGQAVPPPQAVSPNQPPTIGGPPTTGGHYYAGSVYNGVAKGAYWLITTITTPSATPLASEFYYVLLSAWGNAASYDQIGFAAYSGHWGLTYSWTTGKTTSCTGTITYHYSANAKVLTAGQQYLFAMTTMETDGKVHGYVWFEAYTMPGQVLVWALHSYTHDWKFLVQGFYCGYYDYTDYQETYGWTSAANPNPYGASWYLYFYFTQTWWGTGTVGPPWTAATWTAWHTSNAPPLNYASISGNNVYVYN